MTSWLFQKISTVDGGIWFHCSDTLTQVPLFSNWPARTRDGVVVVCVDDVDDDVCVVVRVTVSTSVPLFPAAS